MSLTNILERTIGRILNKLHSNCTGLLLDTELESFTDDLHLSLW